MGFQKKFGWGWVGGVSSFQGQFHEDRDKVKINKLFYFHCKLIALIQTVLYVLGKSIFILLEHLYL